MPSSPRAGRGPVPTTAGSNACCSNVCTGPSVTTPVGTRRTAGGPPRAYPPAYGCSACARAAGRHRRRPGRGRPVRGRPVARGRRRTVRVGARVLPRGRVRRAGPRVLPLRRRRAPVVRAGSRARGRAGVGARVRLPRGGVLAVRGGGRLRREPSRGATSRSRSVPSGTTPRSGRSRSTARSTTTRCARSRTCSARCDV
ncbi:hypothetical protein FOG94_14045 [Cellulosimicrobium cellulans]|uniref:Uncharacterized protein n=1 Tax=Cellulosimicrobium cellulans TaxID=1710 RepID=A0ABX5XIT5_CELCE|nr:hypothetical protein FOG94_14045 [Cellulosimicrobium cellulans]